MSVGAGPYSGYSITQLPVNANPTIQDAVPLFRSSDGNTYQVSLQTLATFFGTGGGGFSPAFNSNLAALSIYNYGKYVNTPGQTNVVNTAGLVAMMSDLLANPGVVGGMAWIPAYSFAVNATGAGITVTDQSIYQGLGAGADGQSQFIVTPTSGLGDTLFNMLGPHTSGGMYFRNIGIKWASGTSVNDVAFNLQTWGGKIQDCEFLDVPTALAFGGDQTGFKVGGLGCTAERCVIRYGISRTVPNNATAIVMSGEQAQIIGPSEFIQKSISTGGPTGCVCVGWGGGQPGSEHQILNGVHISDWMYGIDFANLNSIPNLNKGAQIFYVVNNEIDAYGIGINLRAQAASTSIASGTINGNTIVKSGNSSDGKALLVIDALSNGDGGSNNNILDINFVGNTIYSNVNSSGSPHGTAQNNQYGILLNGGTALKFTGGKIGNMGNNATSPADGSANVCIASLRADGVTQGTGGAGTVTFRDVSLTPGYPGAGGGASGATNSLFAVLVTATLTAGPITFDGCDMTGYSAGPPATYTGCYGVGIATGASVAVGTLFIRNCPGYNDQLVVINTLSGIAAGVANQAYNQAANVSNAGISYFGPSFVLFTANAAGGTLQVNNGTAQTLLANQVGFIWLNSPYDKIQFNTHAPAAFQWYGK